MLRRAREWRFSLWLAPLAAAGLLRLGQRTLRRVDVGREHYDACRARGEAVIFAFWHGRLLMMPFYYPGVRSTVLISQHRDGEYISRIAHRLGQDVERGSPTPGGAQAFRRLLQRLADGRNVVITPDGPKGPYRRVKTGAIELARLSARPILPLAFGAAPRKILQSWDRFLIPYPGARAVWVTGPPLYVPRGLSKGEGERYQQVLGEALDTVVATADRLAAER